MKGSPPSPGQRAIHGLVLAAALGVIVSTSTSAQHPSPGDWRDQSIYHIFTDRFYDGDPSNNHANPEAPYRPHYIRGLHGGDFKGIEQKLDYIQALGATAIWISPLPQNVGYASYHGYGAHDFYSLAPHWGTLHDLRSMVSNAHARGIYVILDVVCNHTGDRIESGDPGWPAFNPDGYALRWRTSRSYPPPFDQLDHFHPYGEIQTYSGDELILGELSGLDDLKTETQYVRDHMVEIYSHWLKQGDFDGFRLDTIKHVDIGFWQDFNPRIREVARSLGKTNFFQFGEVLDGSVETCGFYTGTMAGGPFANDSVLDFPLYYLIQDIFGRGRGATISLEEHVLAVDQFVDPAARDRLVTFIDNHDVPRFMSEEVANHHQDRLHLALTFLYTFRGIPCLYYGTEQNFSGGRDPANREDMFDGHAVQGPSLGDNFNMTHPTFLHVARLNAFRRLYPELRRGEHRASWHDPRSPGLFAYLRHLDGEEALIALNTADHPQTLPPRRIGYPPGTRMINLLHPEEVIELQDGERSFPAIPLAPFEGKIFVKASRHVAPGPVVTHQSPKHGSILPEADRPVKLRFQDPMDPKSVLAALRIEPAVSGAWTWSEDHRVLTLQPDPSGFAPNTTYRLRIEAGAMTENEQPMHARFETRFSTGKF